MATLEVALGARGYPVHIGADVLARAGELLRPLISLARVVVVTDERVAATPHPERLAASLAAVGITARLIVVPAGEGSKSLQALGLLLDNLLAHGAERREVLVAMGGGVIGDLTGFAAAVLLRGVDYVQVPTTLLAQVDSSVGGKTGINSPHGKNLIGAFHQPRAVLIDTGTLATVPERELRAGYAEVVKHAFIKDYAFFEWLEGHGGAVLAGEPAALAEAIARSVAIKAAVVAADEHELTGERALLNFGHTFAHAYEALAGYDGRLLHGEAVGLGMAQAFRLSRDLGLCNGQDATRALRHLRACKMPTRRAELGLQAFGSEALLAAMRRDKKVERGAMRFVLARGLGDAVLSADVPEDAVRHVLERDE